ncbi:hypothetical protein IR083_10135 [Dysgonomonas sp. GY75]|uniref:hypothetical protein n=1 Tax=Dysgonomonas sp. GY75 TaxID=2780419 RepID=UPI0018847C40|nr:hypothetical protein [Dysgonomonas sp. GY75]MBF0649179.1 hypothetical protein [Dysgonomonas sp. GY75]
MTSNKNSLCKLSGHPEIEAMLERWLEPSTPVTPSIPESYISWLSLIQEYLTQQLADLNYNEVDEINMFKSMLGRILCIKSDLKVFIIKEGGEQ